MNYRKNYNLSFTFIEILLGIFLIIVLAYFLYGTFTNFLKLTTIARLNLQALSILENELEGIKNLEYENIGLINGYPRGVLQPLKIIEVGKNRFLVKTFVRNIDDPFDGTIESTPQDLAPADYKLVELEIECLTCGIKMKPQVLSTIIAPKTVEAATKNGSLYIKVFDSQGKPLPEVNVEVINNKITSPIFISDVTDINGILKLIDIPTGTNAYEIKVSKSGYSSEQTYSPNDPSNPNPLNPHATVLEQSLTTVSFSIDKLSNLNIVTRDKFCRSIGNINFTIKGSKLIGTNPDIIKFSSSSMTESHGYKFWPNLEWDNYSFTIDEQNYALYGSHPLMPFTLLPGTTSAITLIIHENKNPNILLINIKDENDNPLNNAEVQLSKADYDNTLYSGRLAIKETNWLDNYSSKSDNVLVNTEGIQLNAIDGIYPTNTEEWLISNTIDLGTSTNVKIIKLSSEASVPPNTYLLYQIATNNDNQTWNFIGPDGTSYTFFEVNRAYYPTIFTNNRYLRYKIYLKTYDEQVTPLFKKMLIDFSSNCLPQGQVFFDNLSPGRYNLTIYKGGYEIYSTVVDLYEEYKILNINLYPL